MRSLIRGWRLATALAVWLSTASLAVGNSPTEFVRHTTESILRLFEDPDLQRPEQRAERLTRLRFVADTAFDWEEISRRALAIHWRERTPQERREFVELFRTTVQDLYLERLEAAAAERLEERQAILYVQERVKGPRAAVQTTIVTKRRREFPMEYRLHHTDGQWRVYDIVIAGVSLVGNYRSQFHRIISQSSYEGLVQQLQARQLGEPVVDPSPTPR
jgi:phospholipid transport system substrate-binding protein